MYCKNCKNLFETEDELCPFCSSEDICEPRGGDFCFITECRAANARMLQGAFENEGVACELIPSGSGVSSASARALENFKVYVPFEHYEKACDIVDSFSYDSTDDYRKNLLQNKALWKVQNERTAKKYKKALKLEKDADLFEFCEGVIKRAAKIDEDGLVMGCPHGGYHVIVTARDAIIMFNSVTYELIYAKRRK